MFDKNVISEIRRHLVDRHETVAVAESVTSGLLGAALSTAEEAMKFFQGGFILYNLGQKARHLDIDPVHAIETNCVSSKMAEDMALSIADQFSSSFGLAITGYATPVPESDNKLFAHLAISYQGEILLTAELKSDKAEAFVVQTNYVNKALVEFERAIRKNR
ncbi:MAG TPA: nicotinamide-nucleotide amidohydrolase family protein [Daejeonella sp.]